MKQKDLSLVYALKEYARANGKGGPIIEDNKCFIFDDIKAAFNAGRESVVENIPELKWEPSLKGIFAQTPIFKYCIELDDSLKCNGIKLGYCVGNYSPASNYAIEAANRHYKMTIKLALGL